MYVYGDREMEGRRSGTVKERGVCMDMDMDMDMDMQK